MHNYNLFSQINHGDWNPSECDMKEENEGFYCFWFVLALVTKKSPLKRKGIGRSHSTGGVPM